MTINAKVREKTKINMTIPNTTGIDIFLMKTILKIKITGITLITNLTNTSIKIKIMIILEEREDRTILLIIRITRSIVGIIPDMIWILRPLELSPASNLTINYFYVQLLI